MASEFPLADLLDAIKAHDLAGMQAALAAGASIDDGGYDAKVIPLSAAVLAGYLEGVDFLLGEGADLYQGICGLPVANWVPVLRSTAQAPVAVQARIARALFEADRPPLQRLLALLGWQALAEAQPEWIDRAIAELEYPEDIDAHIRGFSPLVWAAGHGTPAMVQRVIDAGADPTRDYGQYADPVAYAAYNDEHWAAIVDLLRAAGTPPRLGQVECGVRARNGAYLDRLLVEGRDLEGLLEGLYFTATGQAALVPGVFAALALKAIDAGLAVTAEVLHGAIKAGDESLLPVLIEQGADVNLADEKGVTPLMVAVARRTSAIDLLIAEGADVNATSLPPHQGGHSALHVALGRFDWETAKRLIRYGAIVPAQWRERYLYTTLMCRDDQLHLMLDEATR